MPSAPLLDASAPGAIVEADRLLAFAAAIYDSAGMRPDEARLPPTRWCRPTCGGIRAMA